MFKIDNIRIEQLSHNLEEKVWQPKHASFINKFLANDLAAVDTTTSHLTTVDSLQAQELTKDISSKLIVNSISALVNWQVSFKQMVDFTHARDAQTVDQILLLQHEPVFTQGINGKAEHLLQQQANIPVMQADRGGQITYHGPKQQIIYLLIDFERKKKHYANFDVKFYARNIISAMENAVVNILTHLGLKNVHAKLDAPGIYVEQKKISSLGIKVTRQGTYHGIAINLDMDLAPFHSINPCGYAGLEMCNVLDYVDVQALHALGLITADQVKTYTHEDLYHLIQELVSEYFVSYIAKCFAYEQILDGKNLSAI
ncbi:lipoyl(octanoyl) transferase LipB [Psittacicella hinzii]|uniref:Octanoyltransferase n=1 Tax=Psittacicella hinzii TaxID=2028575 RepID=A0A3A1YGH5_9GAMM|nr:lipoyl(octanoyl) transferase LipB [Psittacicella hinzii]RIY35147.1 hypothetical protein CKF58_07030 [Psittacicella hinzii]